MKTIAPKDFISEILIKEIGDIHLKHPYISFAIMAIGIEFLGKCLNEHDDWNYWKRGQPREDFEYPINHLTALSHYKPFLESHSLWKALRNGFTHSFVPKETLTLSSKNEMRHLKLHAGKLNLRCEDFYDDFKAACEEVLEMNFLQENKMNRPLLNVPDDIDIETAPNPDVQESTLDPILETLAKSTTAVTGTATTAVFTHKI